MATAADAASHSTYPDEDASAADAASQSTSPDEGMRTLFVPQLRETREDLHRTQIALRTERAVNANLSYYSGGLELSSRHHYERASAEFGAYASTGEEPPQSLTDWLTELTSRPVTNIGERLNGGTVRDVIANMQIDLNMNDDKIESQQEEIGRLRRLLNQETTARILAEAARDMSYEQIHGQGEI